MNRIVLGALAALALVGIGLFWLQGRAQVEKGAPPPVVPSATPTGLPSGDLAGVSGPGLPKASELTREQQRFFRYDRNRDGRISRNEMLSTRSDAFRVRWAAHNVRFHRTGAKRLHHPVIGEVELRYETLTIDADDGLRLALYTAEPGSASQQALDLLASWTVTPVATER